MKEKKERALKRTLAYAGRYKGLTYLSFVLSAATAVTGVMPFVYLWKILKEVIAVHPHYENAVGIVHNGWMAVWFSLITMLVYFGALMCFSFIGLPGSRKYEESVVIPYCRASGGVCR